MFKNKIHLRKLLLCSAVFLALSGQECGDEIKATPQQIESGKVFIEKSGLDTSKLTEDQLNTLYGKIGIALAVGNASYDEILGEARAQIAFWGLGTIDSGPNDSDTGMDDLSNEVQTQPLDTPAPVVVTPPVEVPPVEVPPVEGPL